MDERPTPDFTAVAPGPKGTCYYARMIMCFLMIFIVVTDSERVVPIGYHCTVGSTEP